MILIEIYEVPIILIKFSNNSQTAWDGTSYIPLINEGNYVGPNHQEAPLLGKVNKAYMPYSVEDEIKLLGEVVINGQ